MISPPIKLKVTARMTMIDAGDGLHQGGTVVKPTTLHRPGGLEEQGITCHDAR